MQQPEIRWKQHITGMGYGKKMPIHLALKKYGIDNFIFEVIYICFNEKDSGFAEIFFINNFNCLSPNGYNVDLNAKHIKDNPYLIEDSNTSSAVQSIPSETTNVEYNLGKRVRYPIELWYEIKSLYLKSYSPKEIQNILNISIPHRTMISKLKALGCDTSCKARNKLRGNGRYFITNSEKLNIVEDFKKGLTPVQLEKKYKRSSRVIKTALVQANVYVSLDKKICRTCK